MKTRHNALFAFLATLVLLAGARFASADVQDNAGFFGEDAVRQANFDLKDIKQKYGKDLLVETLPTLPAEVQSQINAQNRDKVYADWAQQRGRDAKLDGVVVLITREPSHLQIGVGNKTQQKAFSLKDRDRLRDQMLTSFKQKQYDQGLLNAVGSYRQTLANNLGGSGSSTQVEKTSPGAAPTPAPSGRDSDASPSNNRGGGGISLWSLVIWGLVIFFVLRLIGGIFRRRTAGPMGGMMGQGNQPGWNQPGYGYGRGGGFGTGLGGGILGGMLGGWLGSHMFGRGGSSAYGAPPPSPGGQEPGVFSNEHDANFASSGGDFGTGGSDFSGGGDFGGGGGDFGGGGGDSGGGGDF
jgi:uncharacterized protein